MADIAETLKSKTTWLANEEGPSDFETSIPDSYVIHLPADKIRRLEDVDPNNTDNPLSQQGE
jgi:hypothetical protein